MMFAVKTPTREQPATFEGSLKHGCTSQLHFKHSAVDLKASWGEKNTRNAAVIMDVHDHNAEAALFRRTDRRGHGYE